jgi:hypothetical protein
VNPPFASAITLVNPVGTIVDVATVRGRFAASLQLAKTPGVLMARYVAMFALNELAVQVMPLSTMFDAPSVTVAVIPEEQTPAVTVPFAQ